MKKTIIAIILSVVMLLTLCSCTIEQGAQTIADIANSVSTADSAEVRSVKGSYLTQYSSTITVGQALDSFLATPMWQYFTGENGEKVVQCSGACEYDNKTIEAKIQFILHDNTFEVGALAFNDISQNLLMTAAFLMKAYESAGAIEETPAEDPAAISGSLNTSVAANSSIAQPVDDVEIGDVNPKTQRLSVFESVEDYLYEYRLDFQLLTESELSGRDEIEVRQLLNALYAYHGYTFENEANQRFFGRTEWYIPVDKTMEQCEAEFNSAERANKETLAAYEKKMGWR